jgi:hypothetical protein
MSLGANDDVLQILATLEPSHALTRIDSLAKEGVLKQRDALALKARAVNRPGYWDAWGSQAATFFNKSLTAFSSETAWSHHDSISYYTLLLDYAYFNARARFAAQAGFGEDHAQVEENCLNKVLGEAPLAWQTARAALELGRLNRFRSGPYSVVNENKYEDALRHLRFVLERHAESDFANDALWHLGGLLAEAGHTDEALEALTRLERHATGTKWEERTRRLRMTILRREISVDSVWSDGTQCIINGQARNIKGELHLRLDQACEIGFERMGRLPFSSEDATWSTSLRKRIAIEAGQQGAAWQCTIPLPETGFYRLTSSFDDTTVACTIGVWSLAFSEISSDSTLAICPKQDARVVVSVNEEETSWRIVKAGAVRAGELVIHDFRTRCPVQVFLTDGTQFGWNGPRLWAPCFELWQDGKSPPTSGETEPIEKMIFEHSQTIDQTTRCSEPA